MFQCIIQQRNGWIHSNSDLKEVFPDIRLQLNEQLRCLDTRMETQVAIVAELQDYFRRRSEVELEYSKNLDKLAKSFILRHKEQKQKREQWHLFSSFTCWQQLMQETKRMSRDHSAISDVYANNVINRCTQIMEDTQRIYRRCREISYEAHEEILKVLHELHTAMKTYHVYQGECRQAETKLRCVESQRHKLEQSIPKEKLEKSKKFRLIEKETQKRKNKYLDAKVKALKAKNEYVLCMDAANATIHKYFVDDLSDIIDCMDFGFHHCIAQGLMTHNSARDNQKKSVQQGIDEMTKCITSLDSRYDKQRFLEFNNSAFMIPKKFEFQPGQKGDELTYQLSETEVQKSMQEELESRKKKLDSRLMTLKTESDEIWKTLETAETTLLQMLDTKDYETSLYFLEDEKIASIKQPETLSLKLRADRQETEDFYLTKFREYTLSCNLISRLQAKYDHICKVLGEDTKVESSPKLPRNGAALQSKARRKRIGWPPMDHQPKLFGGSLEEYIEAANQEIPLIMKSCVRVINLYGLHHQGIFRVSGSQVEINNFRDAFERGEDPLSDVTDASDINSVAGVLKLYLRELREPLFPIIYFDQFMELAQLEAKHEFVAKIKDLVLSLPRSMFVVLRYLFAFLNHLSEFSDENMMDPYNLAICFGPTLVPIPEDKDQVQYQNLVNDLIKNIIIFAEDVFPADGGIMYEKYLGNEPDEGDVGEAPVDHLQDDNDSEVNPSEDDSVFREKDISLQIFGKSETLEATAQFDFTARTERELSFKKGDNIILYTQVSNDWWKGSVNCKEGLIPDKYILLKIRDEDREKLDSLKSCSSEESVRRRTSSSSDSLLSGQSSHRSQQQLPIAPTLKEEATEHRRYFSDGNQPTSIPIDDHKPVSGASECSDSCSADFLSSEEVTRTPSPAFEKSASSIELAKEPPIKPFRSTTCLLTSLSIQESPRHNLGSAVDQVISATKQLANDAQVDHAENGSSSTTETEPIVVRRHWETRSVSDLGSVSGVNFSEKRSLWEKRLTATVPTHGKSKSEDLDTNEFRTNRDFWLKRVKHNTHTPDLVMDLPVTPLSTSPKDSSDSKSSSDDSSSPGPESPDMTTAERFAKQNQCTLKKTPHHHTNTDAQTQTKMAVQSEVVPITSSQPTTPKNAGPATSSGQGVSSFKPQVKTKPQVLRKPVLPPGALAELAQREKSSTDLKSSQF